MYFRIFNILIHCSQLLMNLVRLSRVLIYNNMILSYCNGYYAPFRLITFSFHLFTIYI